MPGETAQRLRTNSNPFGAYGDCPIGSVIGWLGSFTRVPTLPPSWIQCNGQVITDSGSPFYKLTAPSLNAATQTYLRGSNVSGITGGATTATASTSVTPSASACASGAGASVASTNSITVSMPSFSILPTYYQVIWIMRIK